MSDAPSNNKYPIIMKSIDRSILHLALPSVISNITVPLLGLVDLAIAGHIGDASTVSAISIDSMIFNVMYWLFGFLRMGTSGMTSQALGGRNLREVIHILLRSLTVALAIAMVILVCQWPIRVLALRLMHTPAEVYQQAETYYNICVWGVPAMLSLYVFTGWFVGMQDTRTPLFIAVTQNVINILASATLVFVCHWGIAGIASGTLIAQWSGFALSLVVWLKSYGRLRKWLAGAMLYSRASFARLFRVNRDIFIRTLFLVAVNFSFTSLGAYQGSVILAANTLLLTLYTLFSYIMDGIAFAGEALTGKSYGAGDVQALRSTIARLFWWGAMLMLLFTLLYVMGAGPFLSLLTNDANIIGAARVYLPWAYLIPVCGMAAFIYDGIFIGMTATRGMLVSSAIASVLFFVVAYLLRSFMGNHALWLAYLAFLATRGVVQWVWLKQVDYLSR